MSARTALRDSTFDLHQRVDAIFSPHRLDQRDGYARFLRAQAAAYLPCEHALDAAGAAAVLPDWPDRRRSHLLLADLAELDLPVPAPVTAPMFAGSAAILGGIYVLEGSRLGGALLRRSVSPDCPTSFLSASASGAWRNLIQLLDDRIRNPDEVHDAVEAARGVFGMFERSGLAHQKWSEFG